MIPNFQEWTLLDEGGATAFNFTSFISISHNNSGQALSYPVEEGGFVNYNKTSSPITINVTVAAQGNNENFEQLLLKLDDYRKEAVKLVIVTPAAVYESMTLTRYGYERAKENAGILSVNLEFMEVREVSPQGAGAITGPRNPTSTSRVNTGRTQTVECW